MLKTAYNIQGITKRCYKNITSWSDKNTNGNIKIITGLILQPFTSFQGEYGGGITAALPWYKLHIHIRSKRVKKKPAIGPFI